MDPFSWDKENDRLSVSISPSPLHYGRASITRLNRLLFETDDDAPSGHPVLDQEPNFYRAQSLHYGLPLVPGLDRIKERLRTALRQNGGLDVPQHIIQLEDRLRRQAQKPDLVARLSTHRKRIQRRRRHAEKQPYPNPLKQLSLRSMLQKNDDLDASHDKTRRHLHRHEGFYNVWRYGNVVIPHWATLQLFTDPSDPGQAWAFFDDRDEGIHAVMKVYIPAPALTGQGTYVPLPFVARNRVGDESESAPIRSCTLHASTGNIKLTEELRVEFDLNFRRCDRGVWEFSGQRVDTPRLKTRERTLEEVQRLWSTWTLLSPREEQTLEEQSVQQLRDELDDVVLVDCPAAAEKES